VPSAVFTSVTGTFTFSVSVVAPFAYEPPATATFAVVSVSDTSWNIGVAAGKFAPVSTVSLVPLTEITADVGGGVGGAGGAFGGLLGVPDPFEPVPLPLDVLLFDEPGPPAWNGSSLFESKDPFHAGGPSSSTSSTPGGSGTGSKGSGSSSKPPKAPPAPPTPPPTSAVVSVNGSSETVMTGANFPAANPMFQLVSLTDTTAKVSVAGGSYASGAPTLTLKVNVPVTLVNTADGTRYTLELYPQGTVAPTGPSSSPSSSPGTTTPATTPATTTTTSG